MIYASQFLTSNFPIGSTQKGFRLPSPFWVNADGRSVLRTDYPKLSPLFPIGKVTGGVSTLPAVPAAPIAVGSVIAPSLGSVVALSAAGTSALTIDGGPVTTLSITPSALVCTSNSAFMLNAAAAQGQVITDLSGFRNPVALTGGPTSVVAGTSLSRLVHASNLNAASGGTVIALPSASGNQIFVVAANQTAFSAITLPETSVKQAMCWTGTHLLILKAGSASMLKVELTFTGGVVTLGTVTTIILPEVVAAGQGNIASNGNGIVAISGVPSGLLISFNHGETFSPRLITGAAPSDTWRIQYSGDCWLAATAQGIIASPDCKIWQLITNGSQSFNTASAVVRISPSIPWVIYNISASTTIYSMTESTTEFTLPNIPSYTFSPSGANVSQEPTFIKAR